MYKANLTVTLRPSILDPQGKAAHHALQNLGLKDISQVRIGKHIELSIQAESRDEAMDIATEAAKKLLANPVMEDYHIEITELQTA